MTLNSKHIIKWIVSRLLILSFCVILFITYDLYLMDVEDRYGDLQNLYWDSKDGDIIVNKFNSEIGIVELNWHRIYVKKGRKLVDADQWLDPEYKNKYSAAIYRPINEIDKVENLKISDITSRFKLITQITVDY